MEEGDGEARDTSEGECMMRFIAAAIAILLAVGFVGLAIFGDNSESPPIDEVVLAVILLGAAIVTLAGGDLRFLSAAYGIAIGVLFLFGELLFKVAIGTPGKEHGISINFNLAQMLVLLLVPCIGLLLTLFAPLKRRSSDNDPIG
jgi:hypothetical protein